MELNLRIEFTSFCASIIFFSLTALQTGCESPSNKVKYHFKEKTIISHIDTACLLTKSEKLLLDAGYIEKALLETISEEISYKEEKKYGDKIHGQLLKKWKFVQDDRLERLELILNKLKPFVLRKEVNYDIFLVEDPNDEGLVNAFTIAGGNIYVSTALIDYVQSEDELAGLIAHEIGHNENNHCQQHIQRRGILQDLFLGSTELADMASSISANLTASFNQYQELQADKAGVYLMYKAGYDPERVNDFFLRLSIKEHSSEIKALFSSHPYSKTRYQCIKNYLAESKVID
jgi:predicted Zn-dependent protease